MKKKICFGLILFALVAALLAGTDYYNYRQAMDGVQIVHYIAGSGSGYSAVYLTAIVPAGVYREGRTVAAVRRYVISRVGEIPDTIQIVLYESMDKLKGGESYFKAVIRRECKPAALYSFTDFLLKYF